jgi:spore coat protein U-like protein
MSRASRILIAAAALLLPAVPAAAKVTCTVSSPGVALGVYNPKSATNLDGTGSVTVTCTQSTGGITVTASAGLGTVLNRHMSNGTSNLNYNLYVDAARTIVFGNGTAGQLSYTIPSSPLFLSKTIYGRIAALQNVTAGSYSDSLIITVTF